MNILGEVRKVILVDNASGGTTAGIPTTSRQYTTVTNSIKTSDGLAFTLAAGQKAFIQNWDDAAVYVKMGTGASASDATFILKAGTAANDGNGGSAVIDDFVGSVSIAAAAGSPRLNVAIYS